jgi:hypothetical protein
VSREKRHHRLRSSGIACLLNLTNLNGPFLIFVRKKPIRSELIHIGINIFQNIGFMTQKLLGFEKEFRETASLLSFGLG